MKHILYALSMIAMTTHALVIEIDGQADLDAKLKQHPQAVIKLYKPNCPACKQIEGDYIRISNNVPGVTFLAINTNTPGNKAFIKELKLKGLPTLFFVKNNIKTYYERDRNFAAPFEKAVKEHFKN